MISGKRLTMRPTTRMILKMLDTAQVAHVECEGEVCRVWVDRQRLFDLPRLLKLAGFGTDIYVQQRPTQEMRPENG